MPLAPIDSACARKTKGFASCERRAELTRGDKQKRLVLKGEERETKTAASRHDVGPTDRLDLSASVDWQANLEKHP
jgi:hypothetical protein